MKAFGKFQLLEHIGTGGMAEIFLARPGDAALSKLVALKRILPEHAESAYYREMFRREGEIALRFRHPSIVTVHELGKVAGHYYMSMEFFPGKTLAQLIVALRDNPDAVEVKDKALIIKSIADALHYIHEFSDHGEETEIIHRDISPQNILVGFDGATKLIDFGVAKVNTEEEKTASKNLKGKVAYMSPEQVRGEELTKQTDVFSLGVVLWEILTGRKLFTGKSVEEVTRKVEQCDIPIFAEYAATMPMELRIIALKALAKDVGSRYKSAGELSADLDEYLRKQQSDRSQKRLAKALQALFPEDFSHLQSVLKKHEASNREVGEMTRFFDAETSRMQMNDDQTPTPTATPTPTPTATPTAKMIEDEDEDSSPFLVTPTPNFNPPPQPKTVSRSQPSSPSSNRPRERAKPAIQQIEAPKLEVRKDLLPDVVRAPWPQQPYAKPPGPFQKVRDYFADRPMATLVLVLIGSFTLALLTQKALYSMKGEHQSVVLTSEGGESESTSQPTPPPTPWPTPVQQVRVPPSVPMNTPPVYQPPVYQPPPPREEARPQPVHPIALPHQPAERFRPIERKPVERTEPPKRAEKPKRSKKAERNDREVAAQPPSESFAFLTVLSDPDSKIMINGKLAGTEVVNSVRVPADKKVVVRVVPKSGPAKVQTLTFKPYSRNVVEIDSRSPDKP